VHHDDGAAEFPGIDLIPEALQRENRWVLVAVIAGNQSQDWTGLSASNRGDGNLCARIDPMGDLDESGFGLLHRCGATGRGL
jgi:hypothetical protein